MIARRFCDVVEPLIQRVNVPTGVSVQLQFTHGITIEKFDLSTKKTEALAHLRSKINPYSFDATSGFQRLMHGQQVVYQFPDSDPKQFTDGENRGKVLREHLTGLVTPMAFPMVADAKAAAFD